ncbi:hypothetical protein BDP27DRAFT_658025 [Rhodocollybia butyracea]|uniref:Uncharacterized protein n=1 Tax=Rhodocollybia butyracea TaxID=206335 RepID=A0A9P5P6Q6_9AGAR|nr:hypothetical protein BDP27DRAFT_658025 [Rhodocollybia butyracea]
MLITPRIRCFGLIFIALCISAVHAMPTPPIAPHSSNDNMAHTVTAQAQKGPKFRITVFNWDWNEDKAKLPSLTGAEKAGLTKSIQKGLGLKHIDALYVNDGLSKDNPRIGSMLIFVLEALEAPEGSICGGDLPYVGYRALATATLQYTTSIYQLKLGAKDIEGLLRERIGPKKVQEQDQEATTKNENEFASLLKEKLKDSELALETWWKNLLKEVIEPLDKKRQDRAAETIQLKTKERTRMVSNDRTLREAATDRERNRRKKAAARLEAARNGQGNVAEKTVTQQPLPQFAPQLAEKTGKEWLDGMLLTKQP